MSIKHEIKCYTPALYNIVFAEGNERCYGYSCEDGKCICMDREQEGLLCKLVSKSDLLIMNFDGDNVHVVNLNCVPIADWLCQYETDANCSKDFFSFTNKIEDEELSELLENWCKIDRGYEDVLKVIPMIYMINFSNKLENRNSIINLCAFSACQDYYLKELFRSAICRTIACCKKAEKQEQIDDYARAFALMIKKLNDMFSRRTDEREKVVRAIDDYSKAWRKRACGGLWGTRTISSMLEVYRKELLEDSETNLGLYEQYKYNKLYSISKKILETSGSSTASFPQLSFVNSEYENTEYDIILEILDDVKHDKEKITSVWDMLNKVFLYDTEVPTEIIEEMKRIRG